MTNQTDADLIRALCEAMPQTHTIKQVICDALEVPRGSFRDLKAPILLPMWAAYAMAEMARRGWDVAEANANGKYRLYLVHPQPLDGPIGYDETGVHNYDPTDPDDESRARIRAIVEACGMEGE